MGKEIFETSIRRSSQDYGKEPPVGSGNAQTLQSSAVSPTPPSFSNSTDKLTNWLLPKENTTNVKGGAKGETRPIFGSVSNDKAPSLSFVRKFSVSNAPSTNSPQVTLFDAAFDNVDKGMERSTELVRFAEEPYKHLFQNNRVIKEGEVIKYNRAGGSDKPHFILTMTHLIMVELTLVGRVLKFRQVFKLTDMKVGVQPNNKLRIETLIKSFDIGLGTHSECWSWKEAISNAIKSARLAENLPANYEKVRRRTYSIDRPSFNVESLLRTDQPVLFFANNNNNLC